VAGRFPLLTDACVNDHLVTALTESGWDIVRAIELYPERTKDEVLFERAAKDGRVFVTNDRPAEAIAIRWLAEGRTFRGMVAWPVEGYEHRSIGDYARDFGELAKEENPFAYPIRHLKAR
jgi:uncharacterized protein DUF5615